MKENEEIEKDRNTIEGVSNVNCWRRIIVDVQAAD